MSDVIDRRVRKTKKQLRQGLAELLAQKPVKSITVREISELVDINRGTFYLHYKDIYDMVEQIQNEMFEEFNAIIDAHRPDRLKKTPLPMLTDIFQYMSENSEMAAVLMSKNGDAAFLDRLKAVIKEKCLADWSKAFQNKDEVRFGYFFSFVASGCVGVFQAWLLGGMKEAPEEIAALVERIIINGISILE